MSNTYTKRFIEETFPVKEISEISAKEKNIRHGHISTLHIWWARRPLAASRATAFAALIPYPEDEETINYFWSVLNPLFNKSILPKEKKQLSVIDAIRIFIIELSRWENSNNKDIITTARKIILHFNNGIPPKTLDPFGGGGSIPLECLRLGCDSYSNDLNPVAVLIQKCTLEYPQKFGRPGYVGRVIEVIENGDYVNREKKIYVENVLLEDVKYWGNWVLEEAKKELLKYYPEDIDGSSPVAYIWARTIKCQNPNCQSDIPLMRQFYLAKRPNKKIALYPFVKNKRVEFEVVGDGYGPWPIGFDASKGSISQAITKCFVCGSTLPADKLRERFYSKDFNTRLIVVILKKKNVSGKMYRLPSHKDLKVLENIEFEIEQRKNKFISDFGFDPIPDEIIYTPNDKEYEQGGLLYNFTPILLYGFKKWESLFTNRQKFALIVFLDKINSLVSNLYKSGYSEEYSKAIIAYLGLSLDRLVNRSSSQNVWNVLAEKTEQVFLRQSFPMLWDFSEINTIQNQGWGTQFKYLLDALENFRHFESFCKISNHTALNLPFESSSFEAVFTDPPYYDNVPYAVLSDFFYVWLKKSVGLIFPELFLTQTTPKLAEAIAELPLVRGMNKEAVSNLFSDIKTKEMFERMLANTFISIKNILKNNGITIVVYAHKSTEGWETLINSLLNSGMVISAAYPIDTEMTGRMRATDSAALASSIYIVCRKIERQPTAFYNDVKEETKQYLGKKLDRLWNEGISGADFFIAAIGASIEVFGKYEKVIDFEGNEIRADKLLADVRIIVTDYAVKKILHNGFATGISDLTRFYVLCRWEFKAAKIPFDEANKLAHSCHIELSEIWQTKSFVKKEKELVHILGPQDRDIEDLEDSNELIDVLHYSIKLWEKGKKSEMQRVLNESGYAKNDVFFRVAQAIAETLPNESKEKKLLEGFLNLREKISDGFKIKEDIQGDFFKEN